MKVLTDFNFSVITSEEKVAYSMNWPTKTITILIDYNFFHSPDLSTKYNLDPSDVQKLVEYHSLFTMFEVKTEKSEPDDPYEPKDDWVADHLDKPDERQIVTPVPQAKNIPLLPDKDSSKPEPKNWPHVIWGFKNGMTILSTMKLKNWSAMF